MTGRKRDKDMTKREIIDLIKDKEQKQYLLFNTYKEAFGEDGINTKLKREEWYTLYNLLAEIKLRDKEF